VVWEEAVGGIDEEVGAFKELEAADEEERGVGRRKLEGNIGRIKREGDDVGVAIREAGGGCARVGENGAAGAADGIGAEECGEFQGFGEGLFVAGREVAGVAGDGGAGVEVGDDAEVGGRVLGEGKGEGFVFGAFGDVEGDVGVDFQEGIGEQGGHGETIGGEGGACGLEKLAEVRGGMGACECLGDGGDFVEKGAGT
jgi:hypothetical protein